MPTLRTLAIPAAILLSGTFLAGCGDDTEPASGDDEMMEETMAPTEDAMMEEDSMEEDSMEEDSMEEDDAMMDDEGHMEDEDAMEDEG